MTRNCAACNNPTDDYYPAIIHDEVLCRDCHENGIVRHTMAQVYWEDDLIRSASPKGVRVLRKIRDEY